MGGRYHQKYYTCEMNGHKQNRLIINKNDSLCVEMIEHNVVTWLDKMRNNSSELEMIHLAIILLLFYYFKIYLMEKIQNEQSALF